jgi:hypothetical protein
MSMHSTAFGFTRMPLASVTALALIACASSADPANQTASDLDTSSTITPAEFAKAVNGENDWVPYPTCSLIVDTSGPDVVVTLTSDGDTGTLRVPAGSVIHVSESDDHRFTEYDLPGIGTIEVLYASDQYNEIDLTPTAQPKVTCGMYWG